MQQETRLSDRYVISAPVKKFLCYGRKFNITPRRERTFPRMVKPRPQYAKNKNAVHLK
ncbi:protein of unknown function, might related with Transposase [Moritella yayanosii]|uniref:Uncharacterized protein n=1 Tax=Moritella yayanosii TaxID=69539 RepID=A0A330LKG4_9GAMM|nr:protein of unknown function, might related with Transposase [Moritella yayanosii]